MGHDIYWGNDLKHNGHRRFGRKVTRCGDTEYHYCVLEMRTGIFIVDVDIYEKQNGRHLARSYSISKKFFNSREAEEYLINTLKINNHLWQVA